MLRREVLKKEIEMICFGLLTASEMEYITMCSYYMTAEGQFLLFLLEARASQTLPWLLVTGNIYYQLPHRKHNVQPPPTGTVGVRAAFRT